MSEQERIVITECRHQKLAKQIQASPLNNPVREVLLLRLKVASSAGYAAVLREYEEEMELYRAAHLPSYRPKLLLPKRPNLPPKASAPPVAPRTSSAPHAAKTRRSANRRTTPRRRWRGCLRRFRETTSDNQTDFLSVLFAMSQRQHTKTPMKEPAFFNPT